MALALPELDFFSVISPWQLSGESCLKDKKVFNNSFTIEMLIFANFLKKVEDTF